MMPNVFTIIGDAWSFFRKQPVLNHVLLWLMTLPMAAMFSLNQLQEKHPAFESAAGTANYDFFLILLVLFAQLALSIILIWATACTLLISKKLLKNSAGRTRTSFKKVRKDAGKYVANIFLTGILRGCITLLWGLLLIIPGVIYAIRTFFYHVAIVCEGKEFRDALQKSKQVVTGHTWTATWYLLGLAAVLFVPVSFISAMLTVGIDTVDPRLLIPVNIITGGLWSICTLLFTIASVLVYKELKRMAAKPTAVQP